jgi:oxaloacetate decarboxylase alpha subunit
MTSLPEAKALLNWEQPQPTIEELRKQIGLPGISDDELLLRILFPQEHVEATIAAGPIQDNYPRGDKPAMALIQELMHRHDLSYIQVQKGDFSLTLQKHTV